MGVINATNVGSSQAREIFDAIYGSSDGKESGKIGSDEIFTFEVCKYSWLLAGQAHMKRTCVSSLGENVVDSTATCTKVAHTIATSKHYHKQKKENNKRRIMIKCIYIK